MLIPSKIYFKSTQQRKGIILIKESTCQGDITSINMSVPGVRDPKQMKQMLTDVKTKIAVQYSIFQYYTFNN
jgi:hypothetical protein